MKIASTMFVELLWWIPDKIQTCEVDLWEQREVEVLFWYFEEGNVLFIIGRTRFKSKSVIFILGILFCHWSENDNVLWVLIVAYFRLSHL